MSQNRSADAESGAGRVGLVLFQPDIAANTGTLLRLAACLGVGVDLIEPAGFPMSERAFRRAGMDYLEKVAISRHASFGRFDTARRAGGRRLVLLSTGADAVHTEFLFTPADMLLLGRESAGVPDYVREAADAAVRVPMRPGMRSLNVAVAGAMVLGEALRQTGGFFRSAEAGAEGETRDALR